MITLNETWLNGTFVVDNHKVEINTSLPTFSVDGAHYDFFAQGEDANNIVKKIHQHWVKYDDSVESSIAAWINAYL